jgi:hypothetical protein
MMKWVCSLYKFPRRHDEAIQIPITLIPQHEEPTGTLGLNNGEKWERAIRNLVQSYVLEIRKYREERNRDRRTEKVK